jgi:hypothetical protein
MTLSAIWSSLEESFDILGDYGYPAMDKAAEEFALGPDYFTWVAAIWLFGSETITTEQYMRMFPYGLAGVNEARFASAVQDGYMISNGRGRYTHTEEGLEIAKKLWRAAGDSLASLKPMPPENLQRLFGYFDRLIEASLAASEPPPHFYISHKRDNYGRLGTESQLEDFVVRFGALSAYRDDSHIAAWQALGVNGHTWDIFTRLWQSISPVSVEQVFERVGYRVVHMEVIVDALQTLSKRCWIEENEGKYQVTAEGKRIREEAEALTDQYFFTPWSCLGEDELEDLSAQARQLCKGLKESARK